MKYRELHFIHASEMVLTHQTTIIIERNLKEKSKTLKNRFKKIKKNNLIVKDGKELIPLKIYNKYLEEIMNNSKYYFEINNRIFNLKMKNYSLKDSLYSMYMNINNANIKFTNEILKYLQDVNIAYSVMIL